MKVVAMLGGLGSQMFKYAFYLALREETGEECQIDTTPFRVMKMWNGYELERIFGIRTEDIGKKWKNEERYRNNRKTKWTLEGSVFALNDMEKKKKKVLFYRRGICVRWRGKNGFLRVVSTMKLILRSRVVLWFSARNHSGDTYPEGFLERKESAYFGEFDHRSDFYFRKYRSLVKETFRFPDFVKEQNREIAGRMMEGNSVALHVRRGDHMYDNGDLFQSGYFAKAVNFIKNYTKEKQIFYIFSGEMEWCREHLRELGLDDSDEVVYVDWNCGEESFRDMQLMTYCQHNILPISSFSWWGYYLSNAKNKIVCAPKGYWLEVEHHF